MEIKIPIEDILLPATLNIPEKATQMIIFAHGSGSGRLSPRNRYVAEILNGAGMATLLFDLLTPDEDKIPENRFDIALIGGRLLNVAKWTQKQIKTKKLSKGFFGASTGTAAAITAAAQLPEGIKAIVSRGGRPDLASDWIQAINCPTLLIVGGLDEPTIEANRKIFKKLPEKIEKELILVPGATHLFEETGALEEVAQYAKQWFLKYL